MNENIETNLSTDILDIINNSDSSKFLGAGGSSSRSVTLYSKNGKCVVDKQISYYYRVGIRFEICF